MQGDRTHVKWWTTPSGDYIEIVDVEGEHLPHGAEPHQMRQVWFSEKGYKGARIDLSNGKTLEPSGLRVLVHEQRRIDPDQHERLLLIHARLSAGHVALREQVIRIQASLGHSESDDMRAALRDLLADDYRDHRYCTKEKCSWCRAEALLNPSP